MHLHYCRENTYHPEYYLVNAIFLQFFSRKASSHYNHLEESTRTEDFPGVRFFRVADFTKRTREFLTSFAR